MNVVRNFDTRKAGHHCTDIMAIDKMNDKRRDACSEHNMERSIHIPWEVENSGVGLKGPENELKPLEYPSLSISPKDHPHLRPRLLVL